MTKDQVKDAPGVENDGELSEAEERRLFEHYGVPYTTAGSTTAQGAQRRHGETDLSASDRQDRPRRERSLSRPTASRSGTTPAGRPPMTR